MQTTNTVKIELEVPTECYKLLAWEATWGYEGNIGRLLREMLLNEVQQFIEAYRARPVEEIVSEPCLPEEIQVTIKE